jgi:hypothetical protein
MADTTMAGWGITPIGAGSQSFSPLSPQQAQQIQRTTAAMSMPQYTPPPTNPQQNQMMQSLMNFGGKNDPNAGVIPNYGQNANATGLGAGTGGMSFPMFGGSPGGT